MLLLSTGGHKPLVKPQCSLAFILHFTYLSLSGNHQHMFLHQYSQLTTLLPTSLVKLKQSEGNVHMLPPPRLHIYQHLHLQTLPSWVFNGDELSMFLSKVTCATKFPCPSPTERYHSSNSLLCLLHHPYFSLELLTITITWCTYFSHLKKSFDPQLLPFFCSILCQTHKHICLYPLPPICVLFFLFLFF